jgi:putative selenium metabolism hydrolase
LSRGPTIDFAAIRREAGKHEKRMVKFLREMIAIPSESAGERKVIARIRRELTATRAFVRCAWTAWGNLHARIGNGGKLVAIDAHVDTVGIGKRDEWKHDPYRGKQTRTHVFGRGAGDQEGAVPAMVYAGKIIKDLKLASKDWSLLLTFTVMEEDCDGLCWQYIHNEEGIKPDCVVVTDSTDCNILRGHRGRMEMGVWTKGGVAMVRCRKRVTTPSTRWPRSLTKSNSSTRG